MLLAPSRTKYRRQHRGRMKGQATRGNTLAFGEYGLQALEPCWLEARQIEAARIALTRFMKRGGKVWIRVFPDKPITAKPAETRMGSGKGAVDHWVAVVKPGRVIFEIGGVHHDIAKEAARLAGHKLPIKVRFITRGEPDSVEA
jgi:large subunit ribosomal protein L16